MRKIAFAYPHLFDNNKNHAVNKADAEEEGEGERCAPPVLAPALPGRGHLRRVRRDVRRGRVVLRISNIFERRVGDVAAERRVVPEFALIEQLKAWYVQQCVKGGPQIAVVARVVQRRAVEHVVRHSSAHLVILGVAQIFLGLIRVDKHIVRMVKA